MRLQRPDSTTGDVGPPDSRRGCARLSKLTSSAQNKSYGDASTYDGMLFPSAQSQRRVSDVLKANPRAIAKMKPPPPTWAGLDAQVVQIPMCSGPRAACEGNCVLDEI